MAKPGLFIWSRPIGILLRLSALAVLTLAFLSPTACVSTKACKNGTVLVTVSLDATSAMADKLAVSVSVAGAAATTTTLDHSPGQTTGTVEVDFPKGYPQGQNVNVKLVALHGNVPIGSGSSDKMLSGACEAVTVMVAGGTNSDGGSDGGGTAGGTGNGGAGGTGGMGAPDAGTGGMGPGVDAGIGGRPADAGTGGTGGTGCPTGQNNSCGVCAATTTDRNHCGATCAVCATTEVCINSCVAAVPPSIIASPPDPAGWLDPNGRPLSITVKDTTYANAIYECRTGPDLSFTSTAPPAWVACDGGTGAGRVHTPVPNVAVPEGNYRTEYRYRADSYVSPIVAVRYYVHHSLDKVLFCPRVGQPADGPHHTDADYFAAALAFSAANPALFPTALTFPAPGAIPARTDAIYLRNPFIKIPFVGITESNGMYTSEGTGFPYSWPATGANYLLNERSLRHSWVMNPARTLILMKRSYMHPANHCREEISVGHGPGTSYASHREACEALVVNTRGSGLCLTTGGAVPIPVAIEVPPNGAGTVTATLNSPLVGGVGTNFVGTANQFIQIPAGTGRWYRIAAAPVPTAASITITPVFAGTTTVGLTYKLSPTATFVLPTGFAKMHPDAHNYATGATAPKTPSPKTKCETLGCNTGLPWITYLPP